jgi:hypothetical protein
MPCIVSLWPFLSRTSASLSLPPESSLVGCCGVLFVLFVLLGPISRSFFYLAFVSCFSVSCFSVFCSEAQSFLLLGKREARKLKYLMRCQLDDCRICLVRSAWKFRWFLIQLLCELVGYSSSYVHLTGPLEVSIFEVSDGFALQLNNHPSVDCRVCLVDSVWMCRWFLIQLLCELVGYSSSYSRLSGYINIHSLWGFCIATQQPSISWLSRLFH